jgi:uncharacterized membrane protein YccC
MKLLDRLTKGDEHGIHYAVSIFLATAVLWALSEKVMQSNPIWAISSMVATSDPLMKQAVMMMRARIINTVVGCLIGLLFIAIGGPALIMLPIAMAVTVLLSSYVVRIQMMWRQAPISAAFVISAGLEHHTRRNGLIAGGDRMVEVLAGCIVGIIAAWVVSVVWPLPEVPATSQEPQ